MIKRYYFRRQHIIRYFDTRKGIFHVFLYQISHFKPFCDKTATKLLLQTPELPGYAVPCRRCLSEDADISHPKTLHRDMRIACSGSSSGLATSAMSRITLNLHQYKTFCIYTWLVLQ